MEDRRGRMEEWEVGRVEVKGRLEEWKKRIRVEDWKNGRVKRMDGRAEPTPTTEDGVSPALIELYHCSCD